MRAKLLNEKLKAKDYRSVTYWFDLRDKIKALEQFGEKHPIKKNVVWIPDAGRGCIKSQDEFWFAHCKNNDLTDDFGYEGYVPKGSVHYLALEKIFQDKGALKESLNEANEVSKFRKGMNVETKDNHYHIIKVEDHSYKYDLVTVIDKSGKKKLVASDWLEQNGKIIPKQRQRGYREKEKIMTKREYEKMIKGAVIDIKHSIDDDDDAYSYIHDSAESMIYDDDIKNYLRRKYKNEYNKSPRYVSDLVDMLANDMGKYA